MKSVGGIVVPEGVDDGLGVVGAGVGGVDGEGFAVGKSSEGPVHINIPVTRRYPRRRLQSAIPQFVISGYNDIAVLTGRRLVAEERICTSVEVESAVPLITVSASRT